ncbi:MAG: hypothetical protein JWM02_3121 [Frankiales bacterium]|nr:hypothetical protein [Frankiales bacterium]
MGNQSKNARPSTARRYTPEDKARAVRLVRQLRKELGTTHKDKQTQGGSVAVETRRLGGLFGAPLATLGVARPAVRSSDPVVEVGDRLARLHRMAWQLTGEERVGACTLADLAVAGVVVHDYASQLLRGDAGSRLPADLGLRRGLARLQEGRVAWRLVHGHVRQLRTTTPALVGLRADVVAVRELLDQLVGATSKAASRGVV